MDWREADVFASQSACKKLWVGGGGPLSEKIFGEGRYCDGQRLSLLAGPHSQKIMHIETRIESDLAADQVTHSVCLQFTTECSRIKLDTPLNLGEGLLLEITDKDYGNSGALRKMNRMFIIRLVDRQLIEEEEKLLPGPRGVPKL
ncbi:hypothetical protein LJR220_006694 [Bradyrhizobium sp. LjRoot220]|uniref:hypothetical protein n=1 Tax=Bradyrhizobium sp. LjRoot220 TaxID=3342284 RepID=UPI003ED0E225